MRVVVIAMAMVAAVSGCRRGEREPPEQEAQQRELKARTFSLEQDELMFVYAGINGRFENATSVADVPDASRGVVRVIDPTRRGGDRGDYEQVYVVDLRSVGDEVVADVMPREQFELRAIAALPAGEMSHKPLPEAPVGALEPHDDIILYGTSWCGACRQARTFLHQRGIDFTSKDVEKDSNAAAEVAAKAHAAGISVTGVPIIDVRGKLVVGFDPDRLATLIGEPI